MKCATCSELPQPRYFTPCGVTVIGNPQAEGVIQSRLSHSMVESDLIALCRNEIASNNAPSQCVP
jgi:hypothetical protein